jgi:hypothetical protein
LTIRGSNVPSRSRGTLIVTSPTTSEITVFDEPVAHIRGRTTRLVLMLGMPAVFGQFFARRGFPHVLGEQLQQAVRAGQLQPTRLGSATMVAAAACSGDSCRPDS